MRGFDYDQTRALLVERFPRCFASDGQPKKPLKIGIRNELIAACPDIRPEILCLFLRIYTRSEKYLFSVIDRCQRVDLSGAISGDIADKDIIHSLGVLKSIRRQAA